jgi:transcriptional regulator with XRE-family HTH domain
VADRLFSALLKYWRDRHGQSQLDLALLADVSARHISYLESGRARPSEEMVLRLMGALGVSLRDQNEALRASGYAARFDEPALDAISPAINAAIERMLAQQEPYPLTVLSPDYQVLRSNDAARRIFPRFIADPARAQEPFDMFALVFDPELARPFIDDWDRIAAHLLARLHRESLLGPGDARVSVLLERVMQYPGVNANWRRPDLSASTGSTLNVWLRRDALALGFMVTVTTFSGPRLVTLEDLRIESYFPLDETTRLACERMAADG